MKKIILSVVVLATVMVSGAQACISDRMILERLVMPCYATALGIHEDLIMGYEQDIVQMLHVALNDHHENAALYYKKNLEESLLDDEQEDIVRLMNLFIYNRKSIKESMDTAGKILELLPEDQLDIAFSSGMTTCVPAAKKSLGL